MLRFGFGTLMTTALACGALAAPAAVAAELPPSGTFDLAAEYDLRLDTGVDSGGATGFAVAPAGDVNGDGTPDLIVGASLADPFGRENAGSAWVVFGGTFTFGPRDPRRLNLDNLDTRGFRIDGAQPGDRAGFAVAGAGDVNGDGRGDLIVGAPRRDAKDVEDTGAAYVVFGRAGTSPIDLSSLGDSGFRITGVFERDQAGVSVAGAGDVNGDGRSDVVVGAPRADVLGRRDAGAAGVVFGKATNTEVSLATLGDQGLLIQGAEPGVAGLSVGATGDMNGDGRPEILVGAPTAGRAQTLTGEDLAKAGSGRDPGAVHVVFGRATGGELDLAALGDGGFTVTGEGGENLGFRVGGLGDVNGDGIPDFAAGAPRADRNERVDSGSVHVIFGRSTPGTANVKDLGNTAMRIDGASQGDALGYAVAPGGDFNNDKKDDILVGALTADPLSRQDSGSGYIVFGPVAGGTPVDLAASGQSSVRFAGPRDGGEISSAAMPGDFNKDGTTDVVLGSVKAGDGDKRPGSVTLVSAPVPPPPATPDPGKLEEVDLDKCVAAENVEFVIDDSGSMSGTDPGRLRAQAVELIVSKPRNVGRVIGALEFGDVANPVFRPTKIKPAGFESNQDELRQLVDKLVQADNGGTDYNAGFNALADENPAAAARIFLTDGEHNVGEYLNGHRNGPPTFVVGLGIGRTGDVAARLARIASETKGSYFPNVKSGTLQVVMNAIDSRLNCDIGLASFVDNLTDPDDVPEPNEVDLDDGTNSVDINVSWEDTDDDILPDGLELLDENDRVLAKIGRKNLVRAIKYSKPRTGGQLSVRGERGDTFFALRVNGVKGGKKVRIKVKPRKVRGKARVHTQISQSRRRG